MKRYIHASFDRPVEVLAPIAEQAGWLDDSDEETKAIRDQIEVVGDILGKLDLFVDGKKLLVGSVDRYINAGWYFRSDVAIEADTCGVPDDASYNEAKRIIEDDIKKSIQNDNGLWRILGLDPYSCKWTIPSPIAIYIHVPKYDDRVRVSISANKYHFTQQCYPSESLAYKLYKEGVPITDPAISMWTKEIKKAIAKDNRINRFESNEILTSLPNEIKGALYTFNYWINEKGFRNAHNLEEAEQILLNRTVNNSLSYHSRNSYKDESTAAISELFDAAEQYNWSVSDIVKYAKQITKYYRDKK